MESKKILMVMALIAILLPSALGRLSAVDFETDSAIADDQFSEAETEIPLSDIILEGLDDNQLKCPNIRCPILGRRCLPFGPRCICARVCVGPGRFIRRCRFRPS